MMKALKHFIFGGILPVLYFKSIPCDVQGQIVAEWSDNEQWPTDYKLTLLFVEWLGFGVAFGASKIKPVEKK